MKINLPMETAKSQLPYCYAIPKDKDINRNRPITSYASHPNKKLLNWAAKALNHMLMSSPLCASNLDQISNVTTFLHRIRIIVDNAKRLGYHVKLSTFDIKEMYTNINHRLIRLVVTILLSWVSKNAGTLVY